MARFELVDLDCAPLGNAPGVADSFFELGMMYSVGRSVPVDLVTAHKWFNLAALRGNGEAIRLRRELPSRCRRPRSQRRSAQRAPGSRPRIDRTYSLVAAKFLVYSLFHGNERSQVMLASPNRRDNYRFGALEAGRVTEGAVC